MTRQETVCKISHYEWMLKSMTLKAAHELWVRDQIRNLKESLAQFHPADHPLHKLIKEGKATL
jgi:hypothetical protein